ncbi:MAG: hypothetical protein R2769_00690 [Saprospiraceae bacterium]
MRRYLLSTSFSLMALFVLFTTNAQNVSGTLQPGYTTFGLNAGAAYQSSDVKVDPKGFGFGLTLGKNIFYRPGAPLSFDLRSRFLYTQSYGLDVLKNHHIDDDSAVNGTFGLNYLNYPEQTGIQDGFIYSNHKTSSAELGGEAVLTLNELKERTGIKVSLFGGLGLDWYNVKINQADQNGAPYHEEYAALNDGAQTRQVLDNLKNQILDNSYETNAGGFENGWGKMKLMPSLGAEIGFQVTPKFSIDFGHRMTFTGRDNFDGDQWSESGNDLLHYTYGGLNFNINKSAPRLREPNIKLIKPNRNVLTTQNTTLVIEAEIENVKSAADINFQVDGQDRGFSFRNEDFVSSIYLAPGKHEIFLSASNQAGFDSEKITVFVEQDNIIQNPPVVWENPPSVRFTSPANGLYESNTNRIHIEAEVLEIKSKSEIRFWMDGREIPFNFQSSRGLILTDVMLHPGENFFKIQVRNNDDTATDELRINYIEPIAYPSVQISRPNDGQQFSQRVIELLANTSNVMHYSDIRVLVNGRNVDFGFSNQLVKSSIQLFEGDNLIEVEVRNNAGTDKDVVRVWFEKEQPVMYPPTVNIIRPYNNQTTEDANIQLNARIDKVDDKRYIDLKVNGRSMNNFSFNGRELIATVSLREGNNTIQVIAKNRGGEASDLVNVIRERKIEIPNLVYPSVEIVEPISGKVEKKPETRLIANTKHVGASKDITILVNGVSQSRFDFRNHTINVKLPLKKGFNKIEVIVKNGDGTDRAETTIQYVPEVIVQVPKPLGGFYYYPKNNSTRELERTELTATVKNVDRKSDIQVSLNGKSVDFTFNRDQVKATMILENGINQIYVKARNSDGQDEAKLVVKLLEIQPAPTVRISRPGDNSKVSDSEIDFIADTRFVDSNADIDLILNNSKVDFNFSPGNGQVRANLNLKRGANQIEIRVKNQTARASDKIKVTYIPLPVPDVKVDNEVNITQKPEINVISVSQPTIDPMNPKKARSTLVAKLNFVKSSSDIRFTVNGNEVKDFLFAQTGSFQVTFPVEPGKNLVELTAKNDAGTTRISRIVELGVNTGEGGKIRETPNSEVNNEPVKAAPTRSKKNKM